MTLASANDWRALEQSREAQRHATTGRLAYYWKKPDSHYWEEHWDKHQIENRYLAALQGSLGELKDGLLNYLPAEGKILEAGCGWGQIVLALRTLGYDCEGLDFAADTVEKALSAYPSLPISVGDVTNLSVPDNYYSGYISLGVIEHLENGPEPFLTEAFRILRPDGIAIFTVPYFSLLRRIKSKIGFFKTKPESLEFYQYAYSRKALLDHLEQAGFIRLDGYCYNNIKGLKDELGFASLILGDHIIGRPLKRWLKEARWLAPLIGHTTLVVCKKPYLLSADSAKTEVNSTVPASDPLLRHLDHQWHIGEISSTRERPRHDLSQLGYACIDFSRFLSLESYSCRQEEYVLDAIVYYYNKNQEAEGLELLLKGRHYLKDSGSLFIISTDPGPIETAKRFGYSYLKKESFDRKHLFVFKKRTSGGVAPSEHWCELEREKKAGREIVGKALAYYYLSPDKEQESLYWEKLASDKQYKAARKGNLREFRDALIQHLPKEGIILQLGCETGYYVLALQARGYNCIGIDSRPEPIEKALNKVPSLDVKLGNLTDLQDAMYDSCVCLDYINRIEISRQQAALKSVRNVLKKSSIAIFSMPYLNISRRLRAKFGLFPKPEDYYEFVNSAVSHDSFSFILKESGFRVEKYMLVDSHSGLSEDFAFASKRLKPFKKFVNRQIWLNTIFADKIIFVCKAE